ncbi:hypothetical protein EYW49_21130 [Siculibacillus lacustris]|uniref:Right-handed parallel beta-helix repeat-containing protein n=1 Tax=Siculibacillus lacustris TaxID=1549641 RepID=A0A4Q9VE05_9HYPH|nr:hypothetical protein [Siculibacillus lacustris]TBW32958.1 hypothetical protein EYW49_21130 [Siculibacillus lacustris]
MITLTRRGLIGGALTAPWAMRDAAFAATGDVFHVDSVSGSDAADGRSPATAWKTTEKVSAGRYRAGSSILFRRGRSFPLSSTLRLQSATGGHRHLETGEAPVTLGAYGGSPGEPLPRISSWKVLDPAGWTSAGPDLWRIDVNAALLPEGSHTPGRDGANIGRLSVDGAIKTVKKRSAVALKSDWEFFSDQEQFLYVFSHDNPKDRAATIKASPNVRMLALDSGITARDLWFEGTGGNAADLYWDTDIQWCVFHTIGGSFLSDGRRYGNGVQQFGSGYDITARNNLFWECYDTALTCQGYPMDKPNSGWENIDYSDNWIARCQSAMEIWATYGKGKALGTCPPGSGFRNVRARRLRLFDLGRGASRLGRLDYQIWAAFIEPAPIETPYRPVPISVAEMKNCSDRLLFGPSSQDRTRPALDFVLEPSDLSLPEKSLIANGSGYRVEQWDAYVRQTGIGVGSTMRIEPEATTGFGETVLTPFETLHARWAASRG